MVRSREAALALRDTSSFPWTWRWSVLWDQLVVRPDGEFDFTMKQGTTRYT